MQPSNFFGLPLSTLYWEAQLNLHVYSTITFKEEVDFVQRSTTCANELPSHSLPDPCSVAFMWKLLKLGIPEVAQTTVVKMCIILIKSEKISIPYHKNTRTSIKSRKMQFLILSPKSLKNYLVIYFKWFFFTNRISLKDTISVFPNLFIYFAASDSDRYPSCLEGKQFVP